MVPLRGAVDCLLDYFYASSSCFVLVSPVCHLYNIYFLHVLLLLLASTLSLLLHILFCVLQLLTGRCAGIWHAVLSRNHFSSVKADAVYRLVCWADADQFVHLAPRLILHSSKLKHFMWDGPRIMWHPAETTEKIDLCISLYKENIFTVRCNYFWKSYKWLRVYTPLELFVLRKHAYTSCGHATHPIGVFCYSIDGCVLSSKLWFQESQLCLGGVILIGHSDIFGCSYRFSTSPVK